MNKGELIQALAAQTGMNGAEANRALDGFLEVVKGELVKGQQVSLVGFGTFSVSKRNARTGKNPRTGEAIKIAARKVPKFSPGKGLRDAVNGAAKKSGAKAPAKGGAKAASKGAAKGGAKSAAKGGKKR